MLREERMWCSGGMTKVAGAVTASEVSRVRGKGHCCRCGRFDGGVGAGTGDAKHELKVTVKEHGGRGNTVHRF